jgi:hypothetical protein
MKYQFGDLLKIEFYDHLSLSPEWHDLAYIKGYEIPVGECYGRLVYEDHLTLRVASMVIIENGKITDMGSCHLCVRAAIKNIEKLKNSPIPGKKPKHIKNLQ